MVRPPREYCFVICAFDDLLLQAQECFFALTVEKRHVYVKQPQQAVCCVLGAGSHPSGRPTHLLRYTCREYTIWLAQDFCGDSCCLFNICRKRSLVAKSLPGTIIEDDPFRSQELLECPASFVHVHLVRYKCFRGERKVLQTMHY